MMGTSELAPNELAVRARQGQVEKHEVRSGGKGELRGARKILAGARLIPFALEQANELGTDRLVVLYHIDLRHTSLLRGFIPDRFLQRLLKLPFSRIR